MDAPGENLLIKLWDTITERGIGSLLKPWQMRREGKAAVDVQRETLLALAQADMDVAAIRAGTKVLLADGKLVALPNSSPGNPDAAVSPLLPNLAGASMRRAAAETLRQEVSVSRAIAYAEGELAQESQETPQENVNEDWLLRWRENASAISSNELQLIWGKVLAGEVKSPGAFSLRTLEFLRNISRDDATLIEKLAPYVIAQFVVRPEPPNSSVGALDFTRLMLLQELGILSSVEAVGLTTHISSVVEGAFVRTLLCHGRVLVVRHDDAAKILSIPIYIVTRLGTEILQLGWKQADEDCRGLICLDTSIGGKSTI